MVGQGPSGRRRIEVAEGGGDHDGGGGVGRRKVQRAAASGQGAHPGVEVVPRGGGAWAGGARVQSGQSGDGVAGAPQFHEGGGGGPDVAAPGRAGGWWRAEGAGPGGQGAGQGMAAVGERADQDAVALGEMCGPVGGGIGMGQGMGVGDPVRYLATVAGGVRVRSLNRVVLHGRRSGTVPPLPSPAAEPAPSVPRRHRCPWQSSPTGAMRDPGSPSTNAATSSMHQGRRTRAGETGDAAA